MFDSFNRCLCGDQTWQLQNKSLALVTTSFLPVRSCTDNLVTQIVEFSGKHVTVTNRKMEMQDRVVVLETNNNKREKEVY